MQFWHRGDNLVCSLCSGTQDSVNHLFFNCPYSQVVARHFGKLGFNFLYSDEWNENVLNASQDWKVKSIGSSVNRLILGALVYFIWKERNWRTFQQLRRSPRAIIDSIEEAVRLKIMGMKLRENSRVRDMLRLWNIPMSSLQSK